MTTYCDEDTGQLSFLPILEKFDKEGEKWNRFLEFHKQNPNVYENFKNRILDLLPSSTRISSYFVRECIRANAKIKISNDFTPYYARTFIEEFPHLKGLFVLKKLKREKNEKRMG